MGALGALLLIGSSCEGVVGGGLAESELFVVAAEEDGIPVEGGPYEGTVRVRLQAFLIGSNGFPISIAGEEEEVEVGVGDGIPISLGTSFLVPGIYQGVRIVLSDVSAELESGLGNGSLGGSVEVDLSSGPVTIDSSSSLLVPDDGRLLITVDLAAPTWIASTASAAPPRIVSSELFESLVRIRLRIE